MTTFRGIRIPATTILRFFISLVLALLLWGWVTDQADPTVARTYSDVPLQEPQLPEPLLLVGEVGDVTIQLEGPQSIMTGLTAGDLEPRLDLREVKGAGTHNVPVDVDVPIGIHVERITPAQLPIIVDEATSRSLPLEREVAPVEDGNRRLGNVVLEVSEVNVSGPRRLVDQVERVVLPIDIGERTDNFTGQFIPEARNRDNQAIPEVEIRPKRVEARIEVEGRGRNVPVLIQTVGEPADGYEVADRVVNPATVRLDGPDETLDAIVSVSTEPVDIEGAMQQVSRPVGLAELPPGVSVIEPADGMVVVVVQVRQRGVTRTLSGQTVVVTDVAPGLEAVVDPPVLDVVVFAAGDRLAALGAGDVSLRVSAAGLGPGTYELPPTVTVPPEVQWRRTDPASIRVTLRPAGATPAASPEGIR